MFILVFVSTQGRAIIIYARGAQIYEDQITSVNSINVWIYKILLTYSLLIGS